MKFSIKALTLLLCFTTTLSLSGCNSHTQQPTGTSSITIAYQSGIGYAPIHVMEAKNLIEKNYANDIIVNYVKLDSGAAINEGIIGETIDIGCMGIAPAISGVAAGIPYKAMANVCSQSHGLMSNDATIATLSDISAEDSIALVNTGSIQHILLAMAAEKELGDAHALDTNIQPMAHAEGMAALESGTVKLHLTSSPYIYQERTNDNYNELSIIDEVWPSGNSFIVAMASTELQANSELYKAIQTAFTESIEFINTNLSETVEIEAQYLGLDTDTVTNYLTEKDCQYFTDVRGVETMISFMYRAGFIEKNITLDEFLFEGTKGD